MTSWEQSILQQVPKGAKPVIAYAPGRVNLIGEHTDYNQGFVFPIALPLGIKVIGWPSQDNLCHTNSSLLGVSDPFSLTESPQSRTGWSKFVAGMAFVLNAKTPLTIHVHSNLSVGGGVSSSAALEVALGLLWNEIDQFGLTLEQLAHKAQECENKVIGVQCGLMDMTASALSQKNKAMLFDTRNLSRKYVSIPSNLSIIMCDTGKKHNLSESAYNERLSQCRQAEKLMQVKSLREATLQNLDKISDPTINKRAKHIITENQRCLDFVMALQNQNKDQLRSILEASHHSLKNDYEVSCEELDIMAEAARNSSGYIGARMTGAGFGGSCVALVEKEFSKQFITECEQSYVKRVKQYKPQLLEVQPSAGAHLKT